MNWRTETPPGPVLFAWEQVRAAAQPGALADSASAGRELYAAKASLCPNCGAKADQLTWVVVGTNEAPPARRIGWLTICDACSVQVQFMEDEDLTAIANQGARANQGASKKPAPWWKLW